MACEIDQTGNATKTICWGRGDSNAKGFVRQDNDGIVIDVTGFSFKLTVNSEKDPTNTSNQQFTIVGVLVDATNGQISFAPTTVNTDIAPDVYFYDIEQTDAGGGIATLIIAKCVIVQDITKV